MTDYSSLAKVLKAMAHPTRLRTLDMLRRGEICVCHIERVLGKRQAYVSQQLKVLRDAGLVDYRKDGLQVFYRLAGPEVAGLLELLCGAVDDERHEIIAECPCPICSSAHPNDPEQQGERHVANQNIGTGLPEL